MQEALADYMLKMFHKKDEKAYKYLYNLFINDLFAYGISLGGREDLIKDIIQEVYINIFNSNTTFSSLNHLKFYLLKSVKNNFHDINKSLLVKRTSSIEDCDHIPFHIEVDIVDLTLDQEQQSILKNKINEMLSILTDRQREAVYLRYTQELEFEEIAIILDMTVGASRKLVSRAIKRLRQHYTTLYIFSLLCSNFIK